MKFGRIALCSMLLLTGSGQVRAAGSGTPAQQPLSDLIRQEQILQQQVKQVHQQLLETIEKIQNLDTRARQTNSSLYPGEAEQTIQAMAQRYTILYVALAAALQNSGWSRQAAEFRTQSDTAVREQLIREKERLETTEKQLAGTIRTVSERIATVTGTSSKQGSIADLDLEKLAGLLQWPVPATKEVSSEYGWRELNGEVEFHGGIDVAAELGDPIQAAADGVVLFAGPAQGFGNWIVIRHEQGLLTVYGHMYRHGIQVKPGQTVRKGQLIARVGAAGQSYGPHLHFGVATGIKDGLLETVSPWSFLQR